MAFDFVTPVSCIALVVLARRTILQGKNVAKWEFLRAAKKMEEAERRSPRREERIREANDQMQRGDAS